MNVSISKGSLIGMSGSDDSCELEQDAGPGFQHAKSHVRGSEGNGRDGMNVQIY